MWKNQTKKAGEHCSRFERDALIEHHRRISSTPAPISASCRIGSDTPPFKTSSFTRSSPPALASSVRARCSCRCRAINLTAFRFRVLVCRAPFKFYGINRRPKLGAKLLDGFFHRRRQVSPLVNDATHRFFDSSSSPPRPENIQFSSVHQPCVASVSDSRLPLLLPPRTDHGVLPNRSSCSSRSALSASCRVVRRY